MDAQWVMKHLRESSEVLPTDGVVKKPPFVKLKDNSGHDSLKIKELISGRAVVHDRHSFADAFEHHLHSIRPQQFRFLEPMDSVPTEEEETRSPILKIDSPASSYSRPSRYNSIKSPLTTQKSRQMKDSAQAIASTSIPARRPSLFDVAAKKRSSNDDLGHII